MVCYNQLYNNELQLIQEESWIHANECEEVEQAKWSEIELSGDILIDQRGPKLSAVNRYYVHYQVSLKQ